MHHHPWLSSLSGILANIAVLSVIMLISWTRSRKYLNATKNIYLNNKNIFMRRFFSSEADVEILQGNVYHHPIHEETKSEKVANVENLTGSGSSNSRIENRNDFMK